MVKGKTDTIALVRTAILGIFLLAVIGTAAELVLLEHYEDIWQWVPLVLMGLSLLVLLWYGLTRSGASLQVFRATMLLFMVAGVTGLLLHYKGNVEFEIEMYPDMGGLKLFWEAITGATPALAPGTMLQLGLLGLVFTWRHPTLSADGASNGSIQRTEE